jgi:DeoR family galactitol utilization operon repressor
MVLEQRRPPHLAMNMPNSLDPSGSLIETITGDRPTLSKAFGRIAAALIDAPAMFMTKSIQDIAATAGVSEPSVVRFCRHYGYNGVPEFRIALAMSLVAENAANSRPFLEPSVADKSFINRGMKLAVARAAAKLLDEDHAIIIDSGSTTQLFAQHLRTAPGKTILTTGLDIVETLWGCRQHTLILPGGTVRFDARALTGRLVEQSLQSMLFDTVYFGADSVDPQYGLSTFNEDEAHQNAAMAGVSQRVVVLVDSTKFRAPRLHRFCNIDLIHTIVTDSNIPNEVAASLRSRGINLLISDLTNETSP